MNNWTREYYIIGPETIVRTLVFTLNKTRKLPRILSTTVFDLSFQSFVMAPILERDSKCKSKVESGILDRKQL